MDGSPNSRVCCYCNDCQTFGRYFGNEAKVLDAQGGTEIVQVCQSRLRFDGGLEQLAAIRLSDKGMVRWYASCCNTPIGNTMQDRKMSFIGLIHCCLDKALIDKDFGTSIAFFSTSEAIGESKPIQHGVFGTILRFMRLVLVSRMLRRYKKSPFFDAAGVLIVAPKILSNDELLRLKTPT